ncbi:MAG TPA: type VI secretion system baseplate subunit TssK [Nannocystaceae bacterium]|nr:type VI secretion system baseplate subunit TssK [Nannocystaceae bacterium]
MESIERVIWCEGMFLAPQHLQQSDRYHEALLDHRIRSVYPHAWGISRLAWDTGALPHGVLRIEELEATLPGGEPVVVAGERLDYLAPRTLDAAEVGTARVPVFVGLPRAGAAGACGDGRHVQVEREVEDVWRGAERVRVPLARRALRIVVGEERRGFECVQVGEVFRDSLGVLRLADDYIPPILRVEVSMALRGRLGELLQRISARRAELQGRGGSRDGAPMERSEFDRRVFVMALGSAFTGLCAVTSSLEVHPQAVFMELCRALGHLSALVRPERALEPPPRYDGDDLRGTFAALIGRIEGLVATDLQSSLVRVPFVRGAGGVMVAELQPGQIERCRASFLIVRGAADRNAMLRELPRLLKMASPPMLEKIRAGAMPGIAVEACLQPPATLPIRDGMVCFQVDTRSPLWTRAIAEEDVALWLPETGIFLDATFELWGMLPTRGEDV